MRVDKAYAPDGFKVIRHKASGHRHWSKNGEIPCCPPVSNYPVRKENYERAKSHCDRVGNASRPWKLSVG